MHLEMRPTRKDLKFCNLSSLVDAGHPSRHGGAPTARGDGLLLNIDGTSI